MNIVINSNDPNTIASLRAVASAMGASIVEETKEVGHLITDKDGNQRRSFMDQREYDSWVNQSNTTTYAGYVIKAKKDFGQRGFYNSKLRTNICEGWVVVRNGCLATPGGVWAHTHDDAMQQIDALCAVGYKEDDPDSGQRFHHLMRAINRSR